MRQILADLVDVNRQIISWLNALHETRDMQEPLCLLISKTISVTKKKALKRVMFEAI